MSDDGPGLADEDLLERVFEPYFRGDTTASTTDGTGLGLTISRSIALAHGGSLVLRNRIAATQVKRSDATCTTDSAVLGLDAILTLPRDKRTSGNST